MNRFIRFLENFRKPISEEKIRKQFVYPEYIEPTKICKVVIIKCESGWYADKIGEWFDVKYDTNPHIVCHSLHNEIGKIIMKSECLTKQEYRKKKLKRILK